MSLTYSDNDVWVDEDLADDSQVVDWDQTVELARQPVSASSADLSYVLDSVLVLISRVATSAELALRDVGSAHTSTRGHLRDILVNSRATCSLVRDVAQADVYEIVRYTTAAIDADDRLSRRTEPEGLGLRTGQPADDGILIDWRAINRGSAARDEVVFLDEHGRPFPERRALEVRDWPSEILNFD